MFGVPAPGLLFWNGWGGPHFLSRGCFVFVVGVYSLFAIGGGEYKRFIYPRRFPVNVEWYREDGCVFILWVGSVELVGDKSIFDMFGDLFGRKGVVLPLVYVVDGVVEEDFMVVDICDVEWR